MEHVINEEVKIKRRTTRETVENLAIRNLLNEIVADRIKD